MAVSKCKIEFCLQCKLLPYLEDEPNKKNLHCYGFRLVVFFFNHKGINGSCRMTENLHIIPIFFI